MESQRGFSLVENCFVLSIVAASIVALLAFRGAALPKVHVAALGFQAALAETRALAMSRAGKSGSGAMLSANGSSSETVLSIYDARPMEGSRQPSADSGFPPLRYPVAMNVAGKTVAGQPFAIFISSSGYASVAAGYGYDPAHPAMLSTDPGCDERAGVAITIADGVRTETHPLDCREAQYEVLASPAAVP